MKLESLNLKYLSRAHTIVGLFALFLFYISTYFGTITLLMPYLKIWESPSRHFTSHENYHFNIDGILDDILKKNSFTTENIELILPSFRDPMLKISSENQTSLSINPTTNAIIKITNDQNTISNFFNELHTGGNIPVIGMPLMGVTSVAMLFLLISGVMLYLYKRKAKQKKVLSIKDFWFKWHKNLGLILLPYIFIFTTTGAFLGLMLPTAAPFALSATHFEESTMRKLVAPIIFKAKQKPPTSNLFTPMLPLSTLQKKAHRLYPELQITKINLYNYHKDNAKIVFTGYAQDHIALSGRINRLSLTLNATNGELIEKEMIENTHGIKRLMSAFYYLHFLPDETVLMRGVFFILGIAFALCLLMGYLIWAEKKLTCNAYWFDFMNRFSIAVMIGIVPSSCIVVLLHWCVPFELFDREVWIKGSFYALWSFFLLYTLYEKSLVKVVQWMMRLSALFLLGAFLFHGLKTKYFVWQSFHENMWSVFYMDCGVLVLSGLFYVASKHLSKIAFFKRYEQRGMRYGY